MGTPNPLAKHSTSNAKREIIARVLSISPVKRHKKWYFELFLYHWTIFVSWRQKTRRVKNALCFRKPWKDIAAGKKWDKIAVKIQKLHDPMTYMMLEIQKKKIAVVIKTTPLHHLFVLAKRYSSLCFSKEIFFWNIISRKSPLKFEASPSYYLVVLANLDKIWFWKDIGRKLPQRNLKPHHPTISLP